MIEAGAKVLHSWEGVLAHYSKVGDHPFFPKELFPWVPDLERDWKIIREELDVVLQRTAELPNFQEISVDQEELTTDNNWKTYFFYGYGFKAEGNCERCPRTTEIIESIPGLKTAFFSVLAPGKHIPDHEGPYKGVLRVHLGLKVPEPKEQCRIRVDKEIRHWEEGKCMVFDDRYNHEVWNDTDGERVVLFLDVERPLPVPVSFLNKAALKAIQLSPYIQDAKKRQIEWEKKFKAAEEKADAAAAKKAAEKPKKAANSGPKTAETGASKTAKKSPNGRTKTPSGSG
jgi:beta-hydroxylase